MLTADTTPLSPTLLTRIDAYWRAANFLSVGQIYLYENPLRDVVDRLPHLGSAAAYVKQAMHDRRIEHHEYIRAHGEDMPEIRDWQWSA